MICIRSSLSLMTVTLNCVRILESFSISNNKDTLKCHQQSNIPEIYRLVYSAFSCEPVLTLGNHEILSREGAQQGDPLGSLEFCEAIHPLLLKLHSSVKIGFMDDLTLSGDLHTVERDITTIMESSLETFRMISHFNDLRDILRDISHDFTFVHLTWTNVKSSQTISQKSKHMPRSMILSVSTRRT